jgi:hypothetical protein
MKSRSLNIRAVLLPLRTGMRRMNLQSLHRLGHRAASCLGDAGDGRLRRRLDALLGTDLPPHTAASLRPTVWRDRRGGLRMRPAGATAASARPAEVRILRQRDDSLPANSAGRMVVTGRFADVCRALDRMAEQAAAAH